MSRCLAGPNIPAMKGPRAAARRGVAIAFAGALLGPRAAPAQCVTASILDCDRLAAETSARSGFASAILPVLHPDGVVLWPGAPVATGAYDVRRVLTAQPALDSTRVTWQPLAVELSRDSTLGVLWGVAVAAPRADAAPPRLGRFIAAWRRDGGHWTLAAFALLGLFPPQGTVVPPNLPLQRPPAATADLAFARLAADSGPAVAFERWAAPDAVLPGGLLTRGPAAIGEAVAGPASWRWHPVAAGSAGSGDLGWTVGEAVIARTGAEPAYSKYLTVWVRRPDGSIRFLTDGGNARPATP